MAHKLSITVEDSTFDNKIIYVNELSEWDGTLEIQHRRLQVLTPFSDKYIIVDFPQNQLTGLNSKMLGLSKKSEDLPDGLYKIHYSVSPNSKVFLEINHYRTAILSNKVYSKMLLADSNFMYNTDECGNVELTKQQNTLLHIWLLLQGVQGIARSSYGEAKSDEGYKQAMRMYDRLFDETCKNC